MTSPASDPTIAREFVQFALQAGVLRFGAFKTKAQLADGTLDVTGTISDKEGRVLLDGYCKFEGKLTKKPAA